MPYGTYHEKTPMNLSHIIIMQMKETIRKAKACLPYGMMLTLLFKSQRVNLEGEDGVDLHHTDIYTSKSLERMGYIQVEGVWRKKGTNIKAIDSSSSEEEEEENEETASTTTAEAGTSTAPAPEPESLIPEPAATFEEIGAPFPEFDMPAPEFMTADIPFPEDQMKTLTNSLTGTITLLFCDLKQSVDSRLSQLEEHVTSLQGKVEAIETSRSAPQVELQPILDLISSSSEGIKN